MAIDHRIGSKVIKNARREDASGTRVDPYPYIGIVKNNLDPTRSGRLQVYIPDLGGPPDDPKNWRTVSYASPYMGYTSQAQNSKERPSTENRFTTVSHTYGMWMVPPDIGVEVIVMFIAGDPMRGYFIACVNSNLSHYMVPALAGTPNVDVDSLSNNERKTYEKGDVVPVVEFNELTKDFTNAAFYNNNKPIHQLQYNILRVQGLEKDVIRGAISSSSQRESPSQVFGISTPGRPYPNDPADDVDYLEKLNSGKIPADYYKVKSRKGGHVFVMDDGATMGEDQLVRLRTAAGHQILMHDTNNLLYIAHADGDSWIELSSDGSLNIYSSNGFSVRSGGDINFHSDASININAKEQINIRSGQKTKIESLKTELNSTSLKFQSDGLTEFKAGGAFRVQTDAKMSLKAGGIFAVDGAGIFQQSNKSDMVSEITPMVLNSLPDTLQGTTGQWRIQPNKLSSIVTTAPCHEPYSRGGAGVYFKPTSPGIQPGVAYQGAVDATKNAGDTGVQNPADDKDLRNQPPCDCTVGNLSGDQLTAYFAQIGKSESGGNYQAVNSIGYVGKYQFGYPALIDAGYVKSSCKSNAQLKNPNNWVGKNGIDSLDTWLANPGEQESAMCEYTKRNYTTMCKIGAVDKAQPPEDIAGMLAVAHLLGPGGAKNYRNGQNSADAYGTTGATYFNKGKYAVAQLAPKVSTVNAG